MNALQETVGQWKGQRALQALNDIKSGYLMKKGQYRYFILRQGELSWYASKESTKVLGSLDLCTCLCDNKCTESNSWSIVTSQKVFFHVMLNI